MHGLQAGADIVAAGPAFVIAMAVMAVAIITMMVMTTMVVVAMVVMLVLMMIIMATIIVSMMLPIGAIIVIESGIWRILTFAYLRYGIVTDP